MPRSTAGTGIRAQHKEIHFGTKPVFRVRSELPPHNHSSPRRENGEGQEGVSLPLKQVTCIGQGSIPLDWHANLDHTSHSPCPTPLQRPPEAQEHSTLPISLNFGPAKCISGMGDPSQPQLPRST